MSEINPQNGREIYESLLNSWGNYWVEWKCAPDILYMNAEKYAEFCKWSALGGHQILFDGGNPYIFSTKIEPIVGFSQDFIWLEKSDINHAVMNHKDYAEKITNLDFRVDDGVTPEIQKRRISIPNEILTIFR